jgi:small subunit ribosomal protein S21|tara:strand:+ start:653 stop:856 length:204 start_codon:yes stop_codon:yes gene_type:complete
MFVVVRDNNVEQAIRTLKKKIQKEGLLKEIKSRQYFEKPSSKRARKKAEGIKRYQRTLKKRLDRLGY